MDLSLRDYVLIDTNCKNDTTFIPDTGAEISIIKENLVLNNSEINEHDFCFITGVTEGRIKTLGKVYITLYVEEFQLTQPFYVVPDDTPIPVDGLLGKIFHKKYKAAVDYRDNCLKLRLQREIYIPLQDDAKEDLVIPPRSEVIRLFKMNISEDSVVMNDEIQKGVFIASTIISKNAPFIKIVNTTSNTQIIKNIKLHTEPLKNFCTFTMQDTPRERNRTVMKILNKKINNKSLATLCENYTDIFAHPDDPVTINNFYEQNLTLIDEVPVYKRQYRNPRVHKLEIRKQIVKMLNHGIIQHSKSPYNSPILLVPKKDPSNPQNRKWRLVVDFRDLNKKLIPDKFPLPRIEDILDQLGKAKFFSVIDLMSGFHQIPLAAESRKYTAFSCDDGFFEFTRLPFGLSVSPNSFSRMMSIAFSGLTPEKAFLYMDDLIVFGISESHHLSNLKSVFEVCRKYNLKLNPDKCQFFRTEVTYLGHHLSDKGILPDKSKFSVIDQFPVPKNADETKRFIAFCNYYRRFIKNFAEISYPLNKLTRKRVEFVWTQECQESFEKLKEALIDPQILKYPDFEKEFIVITDASNIACGAILAQEYDGIDLPVAFASRAFTKGESHKSPIEKELAAIHWALQHFKPYLYGLKFKVKSDHRPLVYLFSMRNPTSKLVRMRMDLEDFDFIVEYIKGKENVGADALSRIHVSELLKMNESLNQNILVVTRSKARQLCQNTNSTQQLNKEQSSNQNVNIFEVLNPKEVDHWHEIKFILNSQSKRNYLVGESSNSQKTLNRISEGHCLIGVNLNNKNACIILKINLGNFFKGNGHHLTNLNNILAQIEHQAAAHNIREMKILSNDDIFAQIQINEFKNAQEALKLMKIAIVRSPTPVCNEDDKRKILVKFHNDPLYGGHCGQSRMFKKLSQFYSWPKMRENIKQYVQKCHQCQMNKPNNKNKPKSVITSTPQKSFDLITIDTVGPLPVTPEGYRYILTIQCELSKFVVAGPIKDKSAASVAKGLFEHFIYLHGFMKGIRTDRGTEYVNQIFSELTDICKITHDKSVPYHPQTIGGLERNHRVLNEFFRHYINETFDNWADLIKYYVFAWNSTPNEQIGDYTPFELIYAQRPNLPPFLMNDRLDPLYNIDNYAKELKYKLQLAQGRAKNFLLKIKHKRVESLNEKVEPDNIKVGDVVKIRDEARGKLDPWFKGPYEVISFTTTNCVVKDSLGVTQEVHLERVKKYYK